MSHVFHHFLAAWVLGDPHFTTLDGADFTFNGWGEYLLLNITNGSTLFELQARTEPVPGTAATQLAAIVFAMFRETLVEVHLVNRELVIYLDGTDRTTGADPENFIWWGSWARKARSKKFDRKPHPFN